jgi:PAS domain S-box-containing protein
MSAEQEAERRLRGLEQQLRRVLWSVSDCLWRAVLSPEGAWAYQSFSPAVERLTGRPARRFVGEQNNWLSLVHPDDREGYAEAVRRMIAGQAGPVEYRMLLPDGGERWLRESVKATPQADRTTLLDGVVSDATAAKHLEQARRRIDELEAEIARLGGAAGG